MFIVLLDEPGLFVFESPEAAKREIEPPDAREIVRAAFDDQGVPYRVESVPQSGIGRFWGGEADYRFVAAGPSDPVSLIALLEEHPDYTNPPEAKAELESLLQRLRASQAGLKPEAFLIHSTYGPGRRHVRRV